jgi:hypothetical protein
MRPRLPERANRNQTISGVLAILGAGLQFLQDQDQAVRARRPGPDRGYAPALPEASHRSSAIHHSSGAQRSDRSRRGPGPPPAGDGRWTSGRGPGAGSCLTRSRRLLILPGSQPRVCSGRRALRPRQRQARGGASSSALELSGTSPRSDARWRGEADSVASPPPARSRPKRLQATAVPGAVWLGLGPRFQRHVPGRTALTCRSGRPRPTPAWRAAAGSKDDFLEEYRA